MNGVNIDFFQEVPDVTADFVANLVLDMTDSHFERVLCQDIEERIAKHQPCFVYFGAPEDVEGGGMKHLNTVASFDNFNNPYENMKFMVSPDPVCKQKFGFELDQPAVGLCVDGMKLGKGGLQAPKDDLSFENLAGWISIEMTKETLKWSDRAHQVLGQMKQNAIILIVPELHEKLREDWMTKVFLIACEYVHRQIEGVVCLVAPKHDKNLYSGIKQLTKYLEIDESDPSPGLYMFHGQAQGVARYDYEFSDYEISPEMVILWARREILKIEVPQLEHFITELKEAQAETEETTELTPEQRAMILQDYVQNLENSIKEL